MGSTVYRCAPEQLRFATQTEVLVDLMKQGRTTVLPKEDLMKRLQSYVDVTREAAHIPPREGTIQQEEAVPELESGEEWEQQVQRGFKRERQDDPRPIEQRRRSSVEELRRRWTQLISVNENRRREGLPPLMELPESADHPPLSEGPVALPMVENADTILTKSLGIEQSEVFLAAFKQMDSEVQQEIVQQLQQVSNEELDESCLNRLIRKFCKKISFCFICGKSVPRKTKILEWLGS